MQVLWNWKKLLGEEQHPSSHAEKWLSSVGAFLGILGVLVISHQVLGGHGAALVVTSMGASSVLLFAAPHSPLSQPWPVFGGHMLSSAIGITCTLLLDDTVIAAAAAVSISIAVMYYMRCLHPPGGAAALAVALGGQSVHGLGYAYLVNPMLINVMILLGVAVLFNAPFPHRRYPFWLIKRGVQTAANHSGEKCTIAHSDLVYALSQVDSFIDVTEDDLLKIYDLATSRTSSSHPRGT